MFRSIITGVTGMRASSGSVYFLRNASGLWGLWALAQTLRNSSASATPALGERLPISTMRSAAWSKRSPPFCFSGPWHLKQWPARIGRASCRERVCLYV